MYSAICPKCKECMIYCKFEHKRPFRAKSPLSTTEFEKIPDTDLLFPKRKKPKQFPPGVPPDYIKDYKEAYAVLNDSPKASAALSRRLLQRLLEEKGNIKKGDLSKKIERVINSKQLSSQLADSIDHIEILAILLPIHPRVKEQEKS